MRIVSRSLGVAVVVAFTWLCALPVNAVPPGIAFSGYVEDTNSVPLSGDYDWEISFYPTETAIPALDNPSSGTVTIASGIFEIQLVPAKKLLSRSEVWYSLAIDTNQNGIDPQDIFSRRFQITSVPFTLGVPQPSEFITHGGYVLGSGMSVDPGTESNLWVCPFETPSGGLTFSQMAIPLNNCCTGVQIQCSFGIYDASGQAVYLSGPLTVNDGFNGVLEINVSGLLESSSRYYTGFGTNTASSPVTWNFPKSVRSGPGFVLNAVTNGTIPLSFDPTAITPRADAACVAITLSSN